MLRLYILFPITYHYLTNITTRFSDSDEEVKAPSELSIFTRKSLIVG
jgi:hypothetical protein